MGKNTPRILIADDEKPLARALSLKLTSSGYIANSVGDGAAALEELKKEKYDILLLDLIMPEMNGFKVLEELNKSGKIKELSVFVLSNLGQTEDIEKTKQFGIIDYVVKSNTTLAEIVNMIKKHLEK